MHCTTIHKQKTQVMITSIIIKTTTMQTQHTNILLQFRSDGEKDEFLKHF